MIGISAIGEIGEVIKKINDISATIASAVEEQTATTNEIARTVGEAAKGANEISENIGGVASAAKNTQDGASKTLALAGELQELSKTLMELEDRVRNK